MKLDRKYAIRQNGKILWSALECVGDKLDLDFIHNGYKESFNHCDDNPVTLEILTTSSKRLESRILAPFNCREVQKIMKTCSETIKLCGLKSTKQVAELNGVTPRTIQLAFKNDADRFKTYVILAVNYYCAEFKTKVYDILEVQF